MSSPLRQGVIILGMHRSGTSALAGALARLGFAMPSTPLEPSADNPEGFYESRVIVEMNFKILTALEAAWNLCFGITPAELPARFSPAQSEVLYRLLHGEFGDARSFVLKDPRMCLLLPLWLPALRRLVPSLPVLLMLRHPAEIVTSHITRNQRPEPETIFNWLHHMLEAEYMSRTMRRGILLYDDLLRDWHATLAPTLRSAGITPPLTLQDAAPALDKFIAPGMRHHQARDPSARIGPPEAASLADTTWRALCTLARNPQDMLALAVLDDARANLTIMRHELMRRGERVILPPI